MCKTLSNLRVSYFRSQLLTWIILTIFCISFVPSVSLAQQPTATINTLSGTVLVNGQKTGKGMVLSAGDLIETQTGASVVLELSDGSLLELGENTKLDIAVLSQTPTGARTSRVKMWWGWVRAKLSPGHQQAGSTFDIETPNALVGVKFSQPDVEVSYDPAKAETVALALTVALAVKNFVTDEEKIIPIGSMAIITALGIKVVAGAVATGTIVAEAAGTGATEAAATGAGTTTGATETGAATGMSTTTKVAIGAGALAAAGGVAIMAGGSDNGGESFSFTGKFIEGPDSFEGGWWSKTFSLTQHGDSISGTLNRQEQYGECCVAEAVADVTGRVVERNSAVLSWQASEGHCECSGSYLSAGQYTATLQENGNILYIEGWGEFIRQE